MAVKIRLKRLGTKKKPFFRIVIADSRAPRDGKCVEEIGHYDPLAKSENVHIKKDRALYWLAQGAKPTETVSSFLKQFGISRKNAEGEGGS